MKRLLAAFLLALTLTACSAPAAPPIHKTIRFKIYNTQDNEPAWRPTCDAEIYRIGADNADTALELRGCSFGFNDDVISAEAKDY